MKHTPTLTFKSVLNQRFLTKLFSALLTNFVLFSLLYMTTNTHAAPASVTLDEMHLALSTKNIKVFDIRESVEHATGVAIGAQLIPLSTLGKRLSELPKPTDPTFYIVCNTQNRSARVVEQLQQMGYKNAQYVHGGMSQWRTRGWNMVQP